MIEGILVLIAVVIGYMLGSTGVWSQGYDRGREHSDYTLDDLHEALDEIRAELVEQGLHKAWKEELPLTDDELQDIDTWLHGRDVHDIRLDQEGWGRLNEILSEDED